MSLKMYLAVLDIIYEKLVSLPIIFLSLTLLLLHFNWQNLIVLLLTIVGSFLFNSYSIMNQDCQQYANMSMYLDKYPHCSFNFYKLEDIFIEKVKIYESIQKEQICKSFLNIFLNIGIIGSFSNQFKESDLGLLCVIERKNLGEIYPYFPKTFSLNYGPSYIITGFSPEIMTPTQRFYLLHEFGHLSPNQKRVRKIYLWNKIQGLALLLLVVIITNLNIAASIIAFIAFSFWATVGNVILTSYGRLELDADSFAIFALINDPEFETMNKLIKKARINNLKQENIDEITYWIERSKDWALNPVELTLDPIRNLFYNFTACTERLRITPLIIRLIMGILILSAALFSKEPNIWGLLILCFVFVVIPFYLVVRSIRNENRLRSVVEMKLHGKTPI